MPAIPIANLLRGCVKWSQEALVSTGFTERRKVGQQHMANSIGMRTSQLNLGAFLVPAPLTRNFVPPVAGPTVLF
ncbi:hypothetical protein HMPREF2822_00215 [Corynebacterium sp. HMSC062E11]|nr:hypothetical protein HMPREF2822_00215 [Corynebacterium sp. HMSC062E11]